jgi:hypothetical protein
MPIEAVSWIICLGAERAVTQGIVRCPLKGNVDLSHCLECHLLETLAAERRRDRDCEAGEVEPVGAGAW